jgi:DNA-binding HxlR family transcriptional regulator
MGNALRSIGCLSVSDLLVKSNHVVVLSHHMPTNRSYCDVCPIARALDVIGERWALLVVRELLLGPQRFSDLRRALPGASSNVLTDRLRELESHGVIRRRTLPPPAGSLVYELTERGRELEPVLDALGTWGRAQASPANGSLSATSALLFMRAGPRARTNQTYRVQLDDRVWTISSPRGRLEIRPEEPVAPDAGIRTDPGTLAALLLDPGGLDAAIASGSARVEGKISALRRLLRVAA